MSHQIKTIDIWRKCSLINYILSGLIRFLSDWEISPAIHSGVLVKFGICEDPTWNRVENVMVSTICSSLWYAYIYMLVKSCIHSLNFPYQTLSIDIWSQSINTHLVTIFYRDVSELLTCGSIENMQFSNKIWVFFKCNNWQSGKILDLHTQNQPLSIVKLKSSP